MSSVQQALKLTQHTEAWFTQGASRIASACDSLSDMSQSSAHGLAQDAMFDTSCADQVSITLTPVAPPPPAPPRPVASGDAAVGSALSRGRRCHQGAGEAHHEALQLLKGNEHSNVPADEAGEVRAKSARKKANTNATYRHTHGSGRHGQKVGCDFGETDAR